MELPGDLGLEDGIPLFLALIFAGLIAIYTFTNLFTDPEGAVDFDVPEPEQLRADWKGEILENPSIKVCFAISGILQLLRIYRHPARM